MASPLRGTVALATASDARVITPSDTVEVATPTPGLRCKAIYVGSDALDITVRFRAGEATVLFSAIPIGTILPIGPAFVMSTGTDALLLVALY